jgi:hypothetical protein
VKAILKAVGVVLLVFGILILCLVGFSIYLAQGDCEGGLSPQPPQGCGYVLHLALYVWGDSYLILYGVVAIAIGLVILVFGRPRRLSNPTKSRSHE